MSEVELTAKKRELKSKEGSKLRKQGLIPAVVYGRRIKPLALAVTAKDFEKKVLSSEAELNLIFNLKYKNEGKEIKLPVITCELQRDSLTDEIIHLDFKHILMDEEIKTKVPIELVGLPLGVKDSGGVLVHGLREIEIKCLPGDIPDKYEVDVSNLNIGQSLHVSDLPVSKKVTVLSNPTEMIANVSAPTKEEELAPPPSPLEAAAPVEGAEGVAPTEEVGKEKAGPTPPGAAPAAKGAATTGKAPAATTKPEKGAAEAKK